jgi:VanZ family protein
LLVSENNKQRFDGGITKRSAIFGISIAISYGLLIEILQAFVFTSRSAEFFDFLANTVGAITAIVVYRILNKLSKGMI